MKLTFLYQPVDDLEAAAAFHRDLPGFKEAWRDGNQAIAFWLPDRSAQIMLATTGLPPGPQYRVDDAAAWQAEHPDLTVAVPRREIPGGAVIGFDGPGSNVFYVFDQPDR